MFWNGESYPSWARLDAPNTETRHEFVELGLER
jgi:hypothetical protein